MGVYGGGVLDEREIGDELDMDKAGMRNMGGEGLKRRYCRDLYCVTRCRKWPLRAIFLFFFISVTYEKYSSIKMFKYFLKKHF